MKLVTKIAVILGVGMGSVGCTVPLVKWGSTDIGGGRVVGERVGLNGEREVVFTFETGEARVVRVPADWYRDAVRSRKVDDVGTILEREALLVSEPVEMTEPDEEEAMHAYAPVFALDHEATLGVTLQTEPNRKIPVDHTLGSVPGSGSYLAVVRFLDEEERLFHVLYGYHPGRFRWVRLSEPIDMAAVEGRAGWAVALFPVCVTLDASAITADMAFNLLVSLGGGVVVGAPFTTISYALGNRVFAVAPTDVLDPIPIPDSFRR